MRSSVAVLFALVACGGGHAPVMQQPVASAGKSYVVWPVGQGTVTAYRFDGTTRGAAIGSAQTDDNGAFQLQLTSTSTGQLLLAISSGTYTEPATGTPISLSGYEMTALLPAATRLPGDSVSGVLISPVSHLVAQLSSFYAAQGTPPDDAFSKANTLLNAHFGGIDWRTVSSPPDLSNPASASIVQLNDAATASLILAGFSMEARNLAQAKNLTPGGPLNSLSLLMAIASDIAADHFFDGQGASSARLSVPASAQNTYGLDGQTVRATLAQGISNFLASTRNASHVAQTDAQSLMTAIATDNNPQLFRDQGGNVDLTPPTIAFVQPAVDASVHGQITIEALATDDSAMAAFSFSSPTALNSTQPTFESAGKSMRLKTTLDVSAMPDGPLTISAAAIDAASNTATQSLTIRIANHGPVINLNSPASTQTVKGVVTIFATASGQNGATIASLSLIDPPAGVGADTLPAADSLSVTWDTTKSPEGPLSLHLQATDSFGGISDTLVPVVVDNVPFGIITAHVSAGAPVNGATVTVYAVDNTTGQPITTVGANGQLGQCHSTDTNGAVVCTLSAENYEGPIQVTASGVGLSFVDPSDGLSVISIPQTFQFSSFVGNYKTGTAITVPLSLWTTLADAEAMALVQGRHRTLPGARLLTDALAANDGLFTNHLTTTVSWDLRSTVPVSLTTTAQSLRDAVYAALPDVALDQLARDRSIAASVTPGGVITAITLTQLLEQDLAADGQFDGLGVGGQQLETSGNPAQKLDANWLRYFMAKALDEWFQLPQNKSGLLSSDIQNAGVFDTVANDTSAIFGSTTAPIPYDNQPPTVSFAATYHAADGNDYLPYGTSRAVSGRLDLTVTASDGSGVGALNVTELSSPPLTLSPGTGSTMPTKFVGSVNTTAVSDGLLTIGTTESDRLGNTGTGQMTYLVDNTPPSLQVTQPVAGTYYTSVVPVDVMASDSSGVLSLTETALGVSDNDQTVPHFFGSYVVPATMPEGPLTPTFKSCDNVHNCVTLPVPVHFDHTPPQLSIPAAPARYTNQGTLSLTVNVSDGPNGAGVAAVYAQNGTASPVAAAPTGGTASFSIPLNPGDNTITLWAVDKAVSWNSGAAGSGNSGKGLAAPYQLTVQVLFDNTAPAPALTTIPSYYDETNMQAVLNGDGSPMMPAAYSYGGTSLRPVDTTGATPVNKATTRMAYGGATPSPTQLLGSNPRNLPFLAFVIPYAAGTDAPITSCTFTATVSCASCGSTAPATGSLIPDTTYSSGLRYLLPIAFDTIPALTQASGQAQVTVNIDAQDAAGNAATQLRTSFRYQPVAPPVIVAEDASYSGENDPAGVYTMKIANATYGKVLGYSGFPTEGPRFARYIIYNPEPVPYAASTTLGGVSGDAAHPSATAENWEAWSDYAPSVMSGGAVCYAYPAGGCDQYPGDPCYPDGNVFAPDGLQLGCTTSAWYPANRTNPEVEAGWGSLVASSYQISGASELAPSLTSNGAPIVPAASGTSPGKLVVYLARPLNTTQRAFGVLSPRDWDTTLGRYQELYATYPVGNGGSGNCVRNADTGITGSWSCFAGQSPWYEYLSSADTKLFGTVSFTSTSVAPGTPTVVGTARSTSPVSFSRNIAN